MAHPPNKKTTIPRKKETIEKLDAILRDAQDRKYGTLTETCEKNGMSRNQFFKYGEYVKKWRDINRERGDIQNDVDRDSEYGVSMLMNDVVASGKLEDKAVLIRTWNDNRKLKNNKEVANIQAQGDIVFEMDEDTIGLVNKIKGQHDTNEEQVPGDT